MRPGGCRGGELWVDVHNDHGQLACSATSPTQAAGPQSGHIMGADLTYSQNYQDTWVVRFAAANGWMGQPGYFLDLGAFNGVYCSNTKLLEEILGWDGVCVEPFPTHSYEGGNFEVRRCLLVDRALTGSLDGKVVAMEGDGTSQDSSLDLYRAESASPETVTGELYHYDLSIASMYITLKCALR